MSTMTQPRTGRYTTKKVKAAKLPPHTQKCRGCGVLLAQNRSVQDHEMFCEKKQERDELYPVINIENFIAGKMRGGNMYAARTH